MNRKKRFLKLYESTINRFTNGGFLTGDVVKLKPNAFNHKVFDGQEETKSHIKAMMDSDLNLRVTNVKNAYPAVMGGSNTDYASPKERMVDVAQEIAPGRYYNTITVPAEVLERVTDGDETNSLPPVPNSIKKADPSQIKPTEVKNDTHNLDNTNVRIPSVDAKPTTSMYLPKR